MKTPMFCIVLLAAVCAHAQEVSQPPATASGPVIVKKVSFPNQTDTIPQTVLYTPTSNGTFRVNIYSEMVNTNPANQEASDYCATVTYTNDSGATQQPVGIVPCFYDSSTLENSSAGTTYFIRAKANTPILFSTTMFGPVPTQPFAYSVYIVIERL